jgi:hypothetical protein
MVYPVYTAEIYEDYADEDEDGGGEGDEREDTKPDRLHGC